jgi:hypothetical protein
MNPHAEDFQLDTAIHGMTDEHLQCRDFSHSWRPLTAAWGLTHRRSIWRCAHCWASSTVVVAGFAQSIGRSRPERTWMGLLSVVSEQGAPRTRVSWRSAAGRAPAPPAKGDAGVFVLRSGRCPVGAHGRLSGGPGRAEWAVPRALPAEVRLTRLDGQGRWLGQATFASACLLAAVSNSLTVR